MQQLFSLEFYLRAIIDWSYIVSTDCRIPTERIVLFSVIGASLFLSVAILLVRYFVRRRRTMSVERAPSNDSGVSPDRPQGADSPQGTDVDATLSTASDTPPYYCVYLVDDAPYQGHGMPSSSQGSEDSLSTDIEAQVPRVPPSSTVEDFVSRLSPSHRRPPKVYSQLPVLVEVEEGRKRRVQDSMDVIARNFDDGTPGTPVKYKYDLALDMDDDDDDDGAQG